ncbi:MAG: hypothetical protein KC417_13260 [Myxococcales bacterium]|nr:hypothetical protein [Myxococcales bacterium]
MTHHVDAERVVLAAGALNTTRLLFRARDLHGTLPRVSAALGTRFSPNADVLGIAFGTDLVRGLSRGPAFNAFVRRALPDARRYLVGELGLPLEALPVGGALRAWLERAAVFVAMGEDTVRSSLRFDGSEGLLTDASRDGDPALFAAMETDMAALARAYGSARAWLNVPSGRGGRRLATVHPVGGAPIGRGPGDGVVDHRGEVFGHPRLYVADGALYPAPPGVPPSLTIAALAERQADLAVRGE